MSVLYRSVLGGYSAGRTSSDAPAGCAERVAIREVQGSPPSVDCVGAVRLARASLTSMACPGGAARAVRGDHPARGPSSRSGFCQRMPDEDALAVCRFVCCNTAAGQSHRGRCGPMPRATSSPPGRQMRYRIDRDRGRARPPRMHVHDLNTDVPNVLVGSQELTSTALANSAKPACAGRHRSQLRWPAAGRTMT